MIRDPLLCWDLWEDSAALVTWWGVPSPEHPAGGSELWDALGMALLEGQREKGFLLLFPNLRTWESRFPFLASGREEHLGASLTAEFVTYV